MVKPNVTYQDDADLLYLGYSQARREKNRVKCKGIHRTSHGPYHGVPWPEATIKWMFHDVSSKWLTIYTIQGDAWEWGIGLPWSCADMVNMVWWWPAKVKVSVKAIAKYPSIIRESGNLLTSSKFAVAWIGARTASWPSRSKNVQCWKLLVTGSRLAPRSLPTCRGVPLCVDDTWPSGGWVAAFRKLQNWNGIAPGDLGVSWSYEWKHWKGKSPLFSIYDNICMYPF